MKPLVVLAFLIPFIACGGSGGGVRRTIENGIEVVLNPAEPPRTENKPPALAIEKTFAIDTEDDTTAAMGVTDIAEFDVDGAGNILILVPPTGPRNCIHKLTPDGRLLASFGRIGQGPGEMEYPNDILTACSGEIWVLESPKNTIHVFDGEGRHLDDRSPVKFESIIPLSYGNHIVTRLDATDLTARYLPMMIELYDSGFKLIKELDKCGGYANRTIYEKVPEPYVSGTGFAFQAETSGDRIFVANSERGYEILVFDLDGRLLRKIRKDHAPVPVAAEYKTKFLESYLEFMPAYAKKIYFPESWHPFQALFPDEAGRLFVVTFEPGNGPGEYMTDVFDPDGVLVHRLSLPAIRGSGGPIMARIRGDRLYAVEEKESGYKRLNVYRLMWH